MNLLKHYGEKRPEEKLRKLFEYRVSREELHYLREHRPKLFAHITKVCNKTLSPSGRKSPISPAKVFDYIYFDYDNSCPVCGKVTKWGRNCYWEFCSKRCVTQSKDVVQRRRATNLARYGVEEANLAEVIKKKKVKTFLQNYGVANPSQADSVKIRKENTSLHKFGVTHWTKDGAMWKEKGLPWNAKTLAKARKTYKERTGYDNPFNNPEVRSRIKQTCELKYGASNPGNMFNGAKRYVVTDSFGTRHRVQGYERYAVAYFSTVKNVKRIVTKAKNIPRVPYTGLQSQKRQYYPDLMIHTEANTHIVEVKSCWTLALGFDNNMKKWKAASLYCEKRGWLFWVMVFFEDGTFVKVKSPKSILDLKKAGIPLNRLEWLRNQHGDTYHQSITKGGKECLSK